MASFYGTISEFDRFLMPRIRNRVQYLARPLKERAHGRCEHCGCESSTLDAAHVHGRDRKTIVREVLEKYRSGNGYHIVDLDLFEQEVVDAHEPIDEIFLFLCKDCHRAYDAAVETTASETPANTDEGKVLQTSAKQANPNHQTSSGRVRRGDVLPITLIPSDPGEFKQAFIASGLAEIREYFQDGHCNKKSWQKRGYGGFTEKSNILGNLRSRAEYRSGVWQESGIVRIEVEVKR